MRAGQRSAASSVRNSIPPPRVRASISDMPLTAVLRSIGWDARCCRRGKGQGGSGWLGAALPHGFAVCPSFGGFWWVPGPSPQIQNLPKKTGARMCSRVAGRPADEGGGIGAGADPEWTEMARRRPAEIRRESPRQCRPPKECLAVLPFFQHADSSRPGATQVERQFDEAALQGVGLQNHVTSEVVDCLDFAGKIAPLGGPIV